MDVILDFSCFDGTSKGTYSILHIISTAASVTIGGDGLLAERTLKSHKQEFPLRLQSSQPLYTIVYKSFFFQKK